MAGEYLRQGADKAEVCSDSYTSCRALYFLVGIELRKRSFHSAAEQVAHLDAYLSQVQSNHFLKTDAIRNRNILKSIIRRWPTFLHLNKLWRTVLHDVSKLEMRSQAVTPGRRSRYPELKIRSFGVAEVVQDSRLILPEDWVWTKAKELFFYLLHSKSPLSSERIVEVLCPGRDFREARSNLYSAIHRIRSCLFPEVIISEARTYQINRAANYWWDVNEFESLVTATSQKVSTIKGLTKLYERLTPMGVIRFFADAHQVSKPDFERRLDELTALLDMHDFMEKRIGKLSTGMTQKVSIVRTMIHDPQVLVLDEPTAGLDVIASRTIIDMIQRCRTAGKTIIFSTHIMSEVSLLSDDLAIIHRGKLCYNGTFDEFRAASKSDSMEQEFIRYLDEAPA